MRSTPELNVGDTAPTRTVGPITQTDIVRFAGAGGDFNPLHHDPDFARRAGFPAPIAMGQFHAALLAGWLTDWVGVERLLHYAVRFVAPVHLGDTLDLAGRVDRCQDEGGAGRIAHLTLHATRDGQPVLTATARVRAD